jgi:hypothetical protein
MNERTYERVLRMVGTIVATEVFGVKCGKGRREDKQEVKQGESGLIPCPFISCLKPIPKLVLVLTNDPYIY